MKSTIWFEGGGVGGAIFVGQFAIKLDRISEGPTDQFGVFGESGHQLLFPNERRELDEDDQLAATAAMTQT